MDGFDEIEPGSTMQAVRDIQAFAEQNPSVKIIVSSRTNFYNKASGEKREAPCEISHHTYLNLLHRKTTKDI